MPVNNWARPNYLLKDSSLGTDSPLERDASTGEAVDSNKKSIKFFCVTKYVAHGIKNSLHF